MSLNNCGCCELPASTPLTADNRPGLSAHIVSSGHVRHFPLVDVA